MKVALEYYAKLDQILKDILDKDTHYSGAQKPFFRRFIKVPPQHPISDRTFLLSLFLFVQFILKFFGLVRRIGYEDMVFEFVLILEHVEQVNQYGKLLIKHTKYQHFEMIPICIDIQACRNNYYMCGMIDAPIETDICL